MTDEPLDPAAAGTSLPQDDRQDDEERAMLRPR